MDTQEEINAVMYDVLASYAGQHTLADSIHAPKGKDDGWVFVTDDTKVCVLFSPARSTYISPGPCPLSLFVPSSSQLSTKLFTDQCFSSIKLIIFGCVTKGFFRRQGLSL